MKLNTAGADRTVVTGPLPISEIATPVRLLSGEIVLSVATRPVRIYITQISVTNRVPVSTNEWISIATNIVTGGSMLLRDPAAGILSGRFYQFIER